MQGAPVRSLVGKLDPACTPHLRSPHAATKTQRSQKKNYKKIREPDSCWCSLQTGVSDTVWSFPTLTPQKRHHHTVVWSRALESDKRAFKFPHSTWPWASCITWCQTGLLRRKKWDNVYTALSTESGTWEANVSHYHHYFLSFYFKKYHYSKIDLFWCTILWIFALYRFT